MAQTTARPFTPVEERVGSVAIRYMSRLNTLLYRLSGGRVFGTWLHGAPIGLLGHRGRKSGQTYTWSLDPLAELPRQISATWVPAGDPAQSVNPVR